MGYWNRFRQLMWCLFAAFAASANANEDIPADALQLENSWFNSEVPSSLTSAAWLPNQPAELLCLHRPLQALWSPKPLPPSGEQSELSLGDRSRAYGQSSDSNASVFIANRPANYELATGRERYLLEAKASTVPVSRWLPKPYEIRGWRPRRYWGMLEFIQCDPAGPVVEITWIIVPRLRDTIWHSYDLEFRDDFHDSFQIGTTWETRLPRLFGACEIEALVQLVDEPICNMPDAVQP